MIRPTLCLHNRGDNMFYTAARGFWLKEENPNQGAQVSIALLLESKFLV